LILATATSAVVVSPSLRQRMKDLGLARQSKLTLLGMGSSNGVDYSCFGDHDALHKAIPREVSALIRPGVPVIGFVGRVTQDKGIEQLVEASRMLSAKS